MVLPSRHVDRWSARTSSGLTSWRSCAPRWRTSRESGGAGRGRRSCMGKWIAATLTRACWRDGRAHSVGDSSRSGSCGTQAAPWRLTFIAKLSQSFVVLRFGMTSNVPGSETSLSTRSGLHWSGSATIQMNILSGRVPSARLYPFAERSSTVSPTQSLSRLSQMFCSFSPSPMRSVDHSTGCIGLALAPANKRVAADERRASPVEVFPSARGLSLRAAFAAIRRGPRACWRSSIRHRCGWRSQLNASTLVGRTPCSVRYSSWSSSSWLQWRTLADRDPPPAHDQRPQPTVPQCARQNKRRTFDYWANW